MTKSKYQYNSWPIGQLPKELQRQELDKIKELGYDWKDPRDVVDIFEQKVAKFAGSKYAVSVDCCTNGMFLCLKYLQSKGELQATEELTIPKRTYVSAAMLIKHAGNTVKFEDIKWSGIYQICPTRVWDSAVRWTEGMYIGNNALQVISFQIKKRIPIGRGGIVLTDDVEAYQWLKLASYDGRDLTTPYTDPNHVSMIGYHMYMTPEDAARGIILIDAVNQSTLVHEDSGNYTMYTDVSTLNF